MLDAPIFRNTKSRAGRTGIVDEIGDVRVRLGLVGDDVIIHGTDETACENGLPRRESRVGMAESENVITPRRGTRLSN